MTQHRRHGLELREGRWCSQRELERLRREAAEDGPKAIERYLRAQERCGYPVQADLPMVRQYVLRKAQEVFPTGVRLVRGKGGGANAADPMEILIEPKGEPKRGKLTPKFCFQFSHKFNTWAHPNEHETWVAAWDDTRGGGAGRQGFTHWIYMNSMSRLKAYTERTLKRMKERFK